MSSAEWRKFCLSLNVLSRADNIAADIRFTNLFITNRMWIECIKATSMEKESIVVPGNL